MFKPGDYVVVSGCGVCRIDSIGHPALSCADPEINYYSLVPTNEKCRIHIPCTASDGRMRPIISKEGAYSLISGIPAIKVGKVKDRMRLSRYHEAIADGRPEALLPVIIEIYRCNMASISKGKGIEKYTEATLFRKAEEMFNCEISMAIGCEPSDVNGIIENLVNTAEKQK